MQKPKPNDYNPFFKTYIDLAPSGDLLVELDKNLQEIGAFFKEIPENLHNFKYDDNKWTIKEVLAHIIDSERVFSYRALVCLRMDDKITLPTMDENSYAANHDVSERTLADLIEEFELVRKSIVKLYISAHEKNYDFKANSSSGKITARALGFAIIGHALHHKNVILEKYFTKN